MSTLEVKPPYATGVPGRTIWHSTIPASASAFCRVSAPAIVVGAIAPSRVNGVTMTGWPTEASSIIPSDMFASSWRGEFVLMPP